MLFLTSFSKGSAAILHRQQGTINFFLGSNNQSLSFLIEVIHGDERIVIFTRVSFIHPPATLAVVLISSTKIIIWPLIAKFLSHPVKAEVLLDGCEDHVALASVQA